VNDVLTWALDLVQSVDPVLRTLIAGIAMLLETSVLVGLVVPGDTIVIVAATAVSTVWEGVALAGAVIVGSLMGESIGFWLGRVLGPRIRDSRMGARIGAQNWQRAEGYLRRRGGPAVFLSRFLPVLHSLVPLTVGMSRTFTYRRFMAWTAPACILWAGVYVTVAALAAGTFRDLSDDLHHAGYVFVGIIAAFVVVAFLAKKLIARAERRHLDDPDQEVRDGMGD
jgi:membrane-associated protein